MGRHEMVRRRREQKHKRYPRRLRVDGLKNFIQAEDDLTRETTEEEAVLMEKSGVGFSSSFA